VEHISVNNPSRFHANDREEEEVDVFCFPAEESSGLFLGIRNGARDLDIADRSDDDELDDVDDDDAATILLIVYERNCCCFCFWMMMDGVVVVEIVDENGVLVRVVVTNAIVMVRK
jgi:hypothetical protein